MKLFDVYSQYDVEPLKGKGAFVYDEKGKEYLDFYGGHAVISVGHSHPHYVDAITRQLKKIGFYSNAVKNSLQVELANKLETVSGLSDYALFLCNSGAEANENAIKLASFHNGKTKIIALENGFHGRTSAAVRATHNPKIQAPINQGFEITYLRMNDVLGLQKEISKDDTCAVIIEPIQGVGGCHTCDAGYMEVLAELCKKHNAILIMDEVQSGYGRSGEFFAFQYADIRPDIITMAKGMGNGFPIAGVMINEDVFDAKKGMLGTTFGGNHLACAAGIAVLEIIAEEKLQENASTLGEYFRDVLKNEIKEEIKILGKGLMIGVVFPYATLEIRKHLLYENSVFCGSSSDPNILRILPPLNITKDQIDLFVKQLASSVTNFKESISI